MGRMNLPGVPSEACTLCEDNEEDNSEHAHLTCSYIEVGAENLLLALQHKVPDVTMEKIKFLHFRLTQNLLDPNCFWNQPLFIQMFFVLTHHLTPHLTQIKSIIWHFKHSS